MKNHWIATDREIVPDGLPSLKDCKLMSNKAILQDWLCYTEEQIEQILNGFTFPPIKMTCEATEPEIEIPEIQLPKMPLWVTEVNYLFKEENSVIVGFVSGAKYRVQLSDKYLSELRTIEPANYEDLDEQQVEMAMAELVFMAAHVSFTGSEKHKAGMRDHCHELLRTLEAQDILDMLAYAIGYKEIEKLIVEQAIAESWNI